MREANFQPGPPGADVDATAAAELADADRKVRIVSSDALLSGRGALAIRHKQAIYYLRETRFGKLILTK
jgi:hemin uptake protein HemP